MVPLGSSTLRVVWWKLDADGGDFARYFPSVFDFVGLHFRTQGRQILWCSWISCSCIYLEHWKDLLILFLGKSICENLQEECWIVMYWRIPTSPIFIYSPAVLWKFVAEPQALLRTTMAKPSLIVDFSHLSWGSPDRESWDVDGLRGVVRGVWVGRVLVAEWCVLCAGSSWFGCTWRCAYIASRSIIIASYIAKLQWQYCPIWLICATTFIPLYLLFNSSLFYYQSSYQSPHTYIF